MKKIVLVLTGLLFVFSAFTGCKQPDIDDSKGSGQETNNPIVTQDTPSIANSKRAYQSVVNKVFRFYSEKYSIYEDYEMYFKVYDSVIFLENSVILDGIKKNFTFVNAHEENGDVYSYEQHSFVFKTEDGKYWSGTEFGVGYSDLDENEICFGGWNSNLIGNTYLIYVKEYDPNDLNNTGNSSAFLGSYSYNDASGSESNGSITLNDDGTWTYEGGKSGTAFSDCTWTSGSGSVTLNWNTAGNPVSETFSVSGSGNSSTWTTGNTGVSLLFSGLFGVMSLSMTFNYTE